jgi:serine/threonine protein kinase
MGEVYRARDLRLRRDVAIKILPAYFASDHDRLRRFEQEATAAAALNHPNILARLPDGNVRRNTLSRRGVTGRRDPAGSDRGRTYDDPQGQ